MVQPGRSILVLVMAGVMLTAGCVGIGTDEEDEALSAQSVSSIDATEPPEATGEVKTFDLYLQMTSQEIEPGVSVMTWAFSTSPDGPFTVPGPTLRATEGDTVRINFHNLHNMAHTVHWHGLHVPWDMDGVPYVSQDPVPSGETFTYEFVAGPAGTHMYHCHVDAKHHIDMGMYGLFIVDPREEDREAKEVPHDREAALMLDEWDKDHVHNSQSLGSNADPRKTGNPIHTAETGEQQARDTLNRPPNPNEEDQTTSTNPLQEQRDWYPVTYPAYEPEYEAYLINGKAFPLTEPLSIAEGERLKVRLANIGFQSHSMHLHGHSFLVTHQDGYKLPAPYRADTLTIGPGDRYDILVDGVNPGVWLFHDHAGEGATSDHISPGGMMTLLVYDQFQDRARDMFNGTASGNYLQWYNR